MRPIAATSVFVLGERKLLETKFPALNSPLTSAGSPNWKAILHFKIRSMRLHAEEEGQIGWTVKDDPRRPDQILVP